MMQISVLKITGYGPWTLTLGSDREHHLQMLQARLYAEVQERFSRRGCLVFQNRCDEYFAVTNGLGIKEHEEIRLDLADRFKQGLSVSVGVGNTPYEANEAAFRARTGGGAGVFGTETADGTVDIMHMDVEDLTSTQKSSTPYDVTTRIFSLYCEMSSFFLGYGSLAFFLGGDNFMVVSGGGSRAQAQKFLDSCSVGFNCGIGTAARARDAARLATESLDAIRRMRDSGGERPSIYEMST